MVVDRRERDGMNPTRAYLRRSEEGGVNRIAQAVDINASVGSLLPAEYQKGAVVGHLHIADSPDLRNFDGACGGRRTTRIQRPDVEYVAELVAITPGASVRIIPVHPEIGAVSMWNIVAAGENAEPGLHRPGRCSRGKHHGRARQAGDFRLRLLHS